MGFELVDLAASRLSYSYAEILGRMPYYKGALIGVSVVGITEHIAGPSAMATLVSEGALGINIEPPIGDPARRYLTPECFTTFNAGKKSIAMDLKNDPLYPHVLREARIIIDNRSKVARVNDLELKKFLDDPNKPYRVIYCAISGYPGVSEWKSGSDVTVQAATGVASVNGPTADQPLKVGFPVLDFTAALWAVIAIQSRLIQMLRGIPIEDEVKKVIPVHITLAHMAANLLPEQYLAMRMGRPVRQRNWNSDEYVKIFDFLNAKDDKKGIAIATLTDKSFQIFCEQVIKRPDLAEKYPTNESRLKSNGLLDKAVKEILATQPRDFWIEKLERAGTTHAPVNSIPEAYAEPFAEHLFQQANDGTQMIARPDGKKTYLNPAPKLNEHRDEIETLLKKSKKWYLSDSKFVLFQSVEGNPLLAGAASPPDQNPMDAVKPEIRSKL